MKIPLVDLNAKYRGIQAEIDGAIRKALEESAFVLGLKLFKWMIWTFPCHLLLPFDFCFLHLAHFFQKRIGVNAGIMPVLPNEVDRIISHGLKLGDLEAFRLVGDGWPLVFPSKDIPFAPAGRAWTSSTKKFAR